MFSVDKYLKRIGYTGKPAVNFETLSELQYRHFLSVPYENLDIINRVPLSLKIDDLFEKIVIRNRGGYCFELNTLFNHLLKEIGFATTTYISRFLLGEKEIPMRRHRVMKVDIAIENASYLADIGVGTDVPVRPLKLQEGYEEEVRGVLYKFTKEPFFGWVLSHYKDKDGWERLYSFTEEAQLEVDFIQPDFYCQYHPNSIFRTQRMVAVRTESGKNSIDGNVFKIASNGKITSRNFEETELNDILKEYFGIVI